MPLHNLQFTTRRHEHRPVTDHTVARVLATQTPEASSTQGQRDSNAWTLKLLPMNKDSGKQLHRSSNSPYVTRKHRYIYR
jgi:hypothetical protein